MNIGLKTKIEGIIQNSQIDENEMVSRLKKLLSENDWANNTVKEATHLSQLLAESLNQIKQGIGNTSTIKTGFRDFDKTFSGLNLGELVVIGARPAMGKNILLVNLVLNIAANNPILYFSFDLASKALSNRFISCISEITIDKFNRNDFSENQKEEINDVVEKLSHYPIYINESCSNSIIALKTICRKHILENGIKVIVIDYLQMMSSNQYRNSREFEVSYIIRELKSLAKEFDVCVIVSSQLSRAADSRSTKNPQLSDLRESGSIEQVADKVIFIHRPEYYGIHFDESGNSTAKVLELIMAKNTSGMQGSIQLLIKECLTGLEDFDGFANEFVFSNFRLDEIKSIEDEGEPF